MSQALDQKIRIGLAVAALKPCYLCGATSSYCGIFEPSRELAGVLGVPEAKRRLYFYALCERCMRRDDAREAVEDRIQAPVFSGAGAT